MVEVKEAVVVSLLDVYSEVDAQEEVATSKVSSFRSIVAFWLLGLINNSGYVIMMAVAKDIAPGAVGVVFLADVAPTMVVKISAPYW